MTGPGASLDPARRDAGTDRRVELWSCYGCYAFLVLFGIGWAGLAGFMPPPRPSADAEEIARQFREDTTGIRVGMVISMFSSALLRPWGGAICSQIRRIDARGGALVWAFIAAQACIVIEFIYPCAFWCVAAFRPEDAARVQSFNDLAWLPFLGIVATGMFQMVALAVLTLQDRRADPVYPRWFAYFQAWCAIGVAPAGGIYLFKTGPLAWNGILAFWLAVTVAFVWLLVTTLMTVRAIKRQPADEGADPAGARLAAVEAELALLRDRVGLPVSQPA
jgi:hypothetical protein